MGEKPGGLVGGRLERGGHDAVAHLHRDAHRAQVRRVEADLHRPANGQKLGVNAADDFRLIVIGKPDLRRGAAALDGGVCRLRALSVGPTWPWAEDSCIGNCLQCRVRRAVGCAQPAETAFPPAPRNFPAPSSAAMAAALIAAMSLSSGDADCIGPRFAGA